MPRIDRIVSGVQTGADRAALDFAINHGLPHGGWCPKGRRAEDGRIPPRYQLVETPSKDYEQRTRWNVRDSDATLIISKSPQLTGGSAYTRRCAEQLDRHCLHVHPAHDDPYWMLQTAATKRATGCSVTTAAAS